MVISLVNSGWSIILPPKGPREGLQGGEGRQAGAVGTRAACPCGSRAGTPSFLSGKGFWVIGSLIGGGGGREGVPSGALLAARGLCNKPVQEGPKCSYDTKAVVSQGV